MESVSLARIVCRVGATVAVAIGVILSPIRCAALVERAQPVVPTRGGGAREKRCIVAFCVFVSTLLGEIRIIHKLDLDSYH